jgi:Ras family protein U
MTDDGLVRLKCVVVGDGAVGKTSLIVSYTTNGYPHHYIPTAFDNYSVVVRVDNQPIRLQLCDTAGQTEFDSLRPLSYPDTDVFLVCFNVMSPTSFDSLASHWLPELTRHSPHTPLILVGTQSDLRTNVRMAVELSRHGESPVSESAARAYARQIGATTYIECSALTQLNLKEVFDAAILAAIKKQPTSETVDSHASIGNSKSLTTKSPVISSSKLLDGWRRLISFTKRLV